MNRTQRCAVWILLFLGSLASGATLSAAETHSVTATEAIQLAIQNDADLRLANLNVTVAKLRLEAAESSTYLPSVALSLSPPSLSGVGLSGDATASLTASLPLPWGQGNLQASLGLDYSLSTWTLASPTWQVALTDVLNLANPTEGQTLLDEGRSSLASTERSLTETQQGVVISTLQAYQRLLSEAQQSSQDQQSVDQLQAQLTQVQDLAGQGYKGTQDVNEAKLLLLNAQVQAEKSATTYASDLSTFCRETLGITADCQLTALDLSVDNLLSAARTLLAEEVPDSAVNSTSSVISSQQNVSDAEKALRETQGEALPSVSVSAKLTSSEWRVGLGISLNLFSPSRTADIQIAEANLDVAKAKLESAQEAAKNQILNQQTSLLAAVRAVESLDLEREKWQLEEDVMTAERSAGTLSDSDWASFVDQKNAFAVDAAGRATSLLVAYLTYREAMGLELSWEEWLE